MKKNYALVFKPAALILLFLIFSAGQASAQSAFAGKPRYQILTTQNSATLGIINVELFPNIAPLAVTNFDYLVSQKFYDTTAFHRVIPGFMIQGGDPNSRHGPTSTWGYGQPGQPTVMAEFSAAKHVRGILSAARSSNPNSATSQFFICVAAAPQLDGQYSIYGRVTSGMSVADAIVNTPRNTTTNLPNSKVEMFVSFIGMNDTIPNPPALVTPLTNTVGIDTIAATLKWNKVNDGIIYNLYVSHDSLFSDTVKTGAYSTTFTQNLLYLSRNTKYYWKVRVNNGGYFNESEIWNFTTAAPAHHVPPDLTGIRQVGAIENAPVVFPNPGRDKFVFSNIERGDLLQITDLNGKLVFETTAGDRTVTAELGEKAKGTYLYKLTRNSKVFEGKIILQ